MERLKIHERIGILRAKQGMSGEEFAAALGLEGKNRRSTITNWESGANNVKADDIENICRVFGVSADWLLGLTEEKNYSNNEVIKMVSDYTGLSTESVSVLQEYQKDHIQSQTQALDLLLSSKEGKAVLGNIFLYLVRNYDAFSMPSGVPADGFDSSETGNSVVLWEDEKPRETLLVENLSEMFMVSIIRNLGKLRDQIQERGSK